MSVPKGNSRTNSAFAFSPHISTYHINNKRRRRIASNFARRYFDTKRTYFPISFSLVRVLGSFPLFQASSFFSYLLLYPAFFLPSIYFLYKLQIQFSQHPRVSVYCEPLRVYLPTNAIQFVCFFFVLLFSLRSLRSQKDI